MELLTDPHMWMALATLTVLELVLGIDNIIFISILVSKLPAAQQESARRIGLLLLLSIIIGLVEPLFTVMDQPFSGRDLILLAGGLFLIWKSTGEIHHSLEGDEAPADVKARVNVMATIVQIMLIDLVFSLDSIITAVGMVDDVRIMIAAVVVSLGLMMLFAKGIGEFVDAHPSIKMLALSFLVVVGVVLVAEGFGHHVPKGYIYFGMAFAFGVEMLNIRFRKKRSQAVQLRPAQKPGEADS